MKTYYVTIDIPAGRSWGYAATDLQEASDQFGQAANGTHPKGTVVTLWEQYGESFAPNTTHSAIDRHTHI